ncbi:transglutaminase-like domain-containing protein [Rufibacter latericius]|uniref:Transglutaminase family protein n=1 Tax=Rufibacter latericius TaxID=2487040 RepID=A0A3M9MWN3_9BACT|nr:transglutaminase family protein [Rufibacter latericius]RNI29178.1 transglutaminase family protein [Rufibacter latericius]
MKFRVSAKVGFEVFSPSTVLLNVQPFPTGNQIIEEEFFSASPMVPVKEFFSTAGEKRFSILEVPEPGFITFSYAATVQNAMRIIPAEGLNDVPIAHMPVSVLPYLNPSRYCQSDRLYKLAAHKFGHIDHGFERVIAIRDWIYDNVEYRSGYTSAQTSAFDTITEQVGVCRDFAHLGIALCRALTIPARYFTGYAYQLQPPDFHACFEAYLGGHWVLFDASKLVPLNGLIKIATGTDATETAFASSFGNLRFQTLEVSATLLEGDFRAVDASSTTQGYSFS